MDDSRIFIVGANGQLGTALRMIYPNAQSADIAELDITNRESVDAYNWSNIDIIINAAAYTNVDGAETPEGRVASWNVNAAAVGNLLHPAWRNDMTLVHVSSDYVFDGTNEPHMEDELFSPLSVYGASKAAGDLLAAQAPQHYILRTSWVIGKGNNFVRTMKSLADRGVKPSVVSDQIGRLTFTEDLAAAAKHLIDTKSSFGTYNVSNDGESASWAEVAKIVYQHSGKPADDVTPVTTEEYYSGQDGIAPRPLQSTLNLDKIKATGFTPRDWRKALDDYLNEEA